MWLSADDFTMHTTAFFGAKPDADGATWASIVPFSWATELLLWSRIDELDLWYDGHFGKELDIGEWVHIAVTVAGDTVSLYLNGALTNDDRTTDQDERGNNPIIAWGGTGTDFFLSANNWDVPFTGKIDELYTFSRALSADEIVTLYTHGTGREAPAAALETAPALVTAIEGQAVTAEDIEWRFIPAGDGAYHLQSVATGAFLRVNGDTLAMGENGSTWIFGDHGEAGDPTMWSPENDAPLRYSPNMSRWSARRAFVHIGLFEKQGAGYSRVTSVTDNAIYIIVGMSSDDGIPKALSNFLETNDGNNMGGVAVPISGDAIIFGTPAPAFDGGPITIGGQETIIYSWHFDGADGAFLELGERGHGEAYALRPEFEDGHRGPQTEVGESQFGGNVGWTQGTEFVQYNINVETPGKYKLEAYLASGAGTAGNLEVSYNGNVIGVTASEDTNGWQDYDWYDIGEVQFAAGAGVIKVEFLTGDTNFSVMKATLIEADPAPAADEPPAEDEPAEAGGDSPADTAPAATGGGDDGSIVLWIIIAAAAIVIVVIIVILVTKKKK
jgi:hypothetical protein